MPKELIPIVNKPLIQYAAEEAIAAGIDTLIFVTGRNKRSIEDHFDANNELEAALRSSGKESQADMVQNILPSGVECIFVRQPEQLGLGHAVLCAERAVGADTFAVLLADDFITDQDPGVTSDLINAYQLDGKSQLSVMKVGGPEISNYGVVVPDEDGTGIIGLTEKPKLEDAPSKLASIGRYVLNSDIFDILRSISTGAGGEIQLADAINIQAKKGAVNTVHLKGRRFDCGSVKGFVEATNFEFKKFTPSYNVPL